MQLHSLLNSAVDEGAWLTSRPDRFTPWEIAPVTHWIGGCMGPRAGTNVLENGKICYPVGIQTSGRPAGRLLLLPGATARGGPWPPLRSASTGPYFLPSLSSP